MAEIKYKIKATDETSKALSSAKKNVDGLSKSAKNQEKTIGGLAKKVGALKSSYLLYAAAAMVVMKAITSSIKAYEKQEIAETKLRAAIKASGKELSISAGILYDYASELQGVTTYGDEVTISAIAMLQQLGDLNEDGLKKTIPLVQDFAAAMGFDLETAASLVGKTLGSSTNALTRYGLEVDMTGTKEEKLASLTEAMQAKFGGMARELAQTGTGALQQYNNALGDIKEEGGKAILDIMAPMLENLTSHLTLTLQNWKATANLNKALKGEATSLYEVDKALSENDERLDEAQNQTLILSNRLKMAQTAFDLEREKIEKGTAAHQTQIGVRADALAAIMAQVDANGKEIEKRVENIRLLKENREEIEKSNVIKTADVIITKAQTETAEALTKSLLEQSIARSGIADSITDMMADMEAVRTTTRETFADLQLSETELAIKNINEQKDAFIKAGVDKVEAEIWAQEEILGIRANAFNDYLNVVGNIGSQIDDIFSQSYDNRNIELDNWYENEKEILEKQFTDEDELAIELGKLDKEYADKKAALKTKEAKSDKTAKIIQATMDTASAIVEALPNIPLSILAGVMGAAQTAMIASQPIPSFAEGGSFFTQGPQMIMVGDNPGGRERVTVEPFPSEPEPNVIHNQVFLDGQVILDYLNKASRNGQLLTTAGSIV